MKPIGCAVMVVVAVALVARAYARPPARQPAPHAPGSARMPEARPAPAPAPPPLPMLPSVGRVDVEVARDHVVVVEDVNLPRGDWRVGGLDLYVAFGAPGVPTAIDARLAASADAAGSRPDEPGEALLVERAVRRSPGAVLLLGRPQMAGVVIHVKESDLRRVYATHDAAVLRIRSLLSPPAADARGARDVVVRLGVAEGLPLTLGRVQVVSLEAPRWVARAEATLCGPDADAWPLAVALLPKAAAAVDDADAGPRVGPIAPAMAVRHATDDLCVRWWAEQ